MLRIVNSYLRIRIRNSWIAGREHGGGPQLREVFWGLGYLFAARGFVVLSYDKRGVGKSTDNWREASFEQLADDAAARAGFLQSRNEVDPKRSGF